MSEPPKTPHRYQVYLLLGQADRSFSHYGLFVETEDDGRGIITELIIGNCRDTAMQLTQSRSPVEIFSPEWSRLEPVGHVWDIELFLSTIMTIPPPEQPNMRERGVVKRVWMERAIRELMEIYIMFKDRNPSVD